MSYNEFSKGRDDDEPTHTHRENAPLEIPDFQEPPPELLAGASLESVALYHARTSYRLVQQMEWLVRVVRRQYAEQHHQQDKVDHLLRTYPLLSRTLKECRESLQSELKSVDKTVERHSKQLADHGEILRRLENLRLQIETMESHAEDPDRFLRRFRDARRKVEAEDRLIRMGWLKSSAALTQIVYFTLAILGMLSGWVMYYFLTLSD